MSRDQQRFTLELYPDGMPLEKIDEDFKDSFENLVGMVEFLSAPKEAPNASNEASAARAPGVGRASEGGQAGVREPRNVAGRQQRRPASEDAGPRADSQGGGPTDPRARPSQFAEEFAGFDPRDARGPATASA